MFVVSPEDTLSPIIIHHPNLSNVYRPSPKWPEAPFIPPPPSDSSHQGFSFPENGSSADSHSSDNKTLEPTNPVTFVFRPTSFNPLASPFIPGDVSNKLKILHLVLPFLSAATRFRIAQLSRSLRSTIYSLEWERQAMLEYLYKMPLGLLQTTVTHTPFLCTEDATEFRKHRLKRLRSSVAQWHHACARLAAKRYGIKIRICEASPSHAPDFLIRRLLGKQYRVSETQKELCVQAEHQAWISLGALRLNHLRATCVEYPLAAVGLLKARPKLRDQLPTPIELEAWWTGGEALSDISPQDAVTFLSDLNYVSAERFFNWSTIVQSSGDPSQHGNAYMGALTADWFYQLMTKELKPLIIDSGFIPFVDSIDGIDESGGDGTFIGIELVPQIHDGQRVYLTGKNKMAVAFSA
eukprot:Blabericola_migrator_1__11728@NODE_709_length_6776_cov_105_801908_g514_i0_p2_GENE_NODE_709_length_6776_cov_105_801908_g514_i0NODE_709_length_6776_cov_105_801908_g514_i0_p2_ORF_typecomplete_len409_score64_81Fbox/PF00646_33/0_25_NODE_709_length_6776_cov_105_801908_g514_i025403766